MIISFKMYFATSQLTQVADTIQKNLQTSVYFGQDLVTPLNHQHIQLN